MLSGMIAVFFLRPSKELRVSFTNAQPEPQVLLVITPADPALHCSKSPWIGP